MNVKQLDLLDILEILARHKKFISIFVLIASIAVVIYVLVVPKYWESTAVIYPMDATDTSMLTSLLGGYASMLGGSSLEQGELVAIMTSRSFGYKIIDKFDVINMLEIEEPDSLMALDMAYRLLYEVIFNIYYDIDTGFIYINAETKDNKLSAEMANYVVDQLDQYNRFERRSQGRDKRMFIEERLKEIEIEMDSIATQIQAFQEENKIFDTSSQVSGILGVYTELSSKLFEIELQLDYMHEYDRKNDPASQSLMEQKRVLTRKLREMESGTVESDGSSYLIALNSLPEKMRKYAELKMRMELLKTTYSYLLPEYESAKIEEIRDLPTIQIIDKAHVTGMRTKPKRGLTCVLVFMAALLFACVVSILHGIIDEDIKKRLIKIFRILLHGKRAEE